MMNNGRTNFRERDSQNPDNINNERTSMNMNSFLRVTPMDAEIFGQELHDKFQSLELDCTQVPRDYVPNFKSVDDLFKEDEQNSANYATTIADDDVIHVEECAGDRVFIDNWTDANLHESLMNNIKRANYVKPREIQKTAIPLILDNYDVLGHAETGSGKTAAYLIPVIAECIDAKAEGKFKSEPGHPYCIILTPTRELVRQCFEQACKFAHETGVTVAKSYGDYPTRKNKEEINRGCDILCISPGRFKHFADEGSISFNKLRFFVFDEGDHLLSLNFLNDIRPIMELPSFPKGNSRQTLFFSATFNEEMLKVAKEFMRPAGFRAIVSNQKNVVNKKCEQEFIAPEPKKKFAHLVDFLRDELVKADVSKKILVFCNTRDYCEKLAMALSFSGITCEVLSGMRGSHAREAALDKFCSSHSCEVLIVSDVCARGIDIKSLDVVVNFNLPRDYDTYVHRAGRVGRIRQGKCISYVSNDIPLLNKIKAAMEKSGQIVPPSLEEILRSEEINKSHFSSEKQNFEDALAKDVNNMAAESLGSDNFNRAEEILDGSTKDAEEKGEEKTPEVCETEVNAGKENANVLIEKTEYVNSMAGESLGTDNSTDEVNHKAEEVLDGSTKDAEEKEEEKTPEVCETVVNAGKENADVSIEKPDNMVEKAEEEAVSIEKNENFEDAFAKDVNNMAGESLGTDNLTDEVNHKAEEVLDGSTKDSEEKEEEKTPDFCETVVNACKENADVSIEKTDNMIEKAEEAVADGVSSVEEKGEENKPGVANYVDNKSDW